MRSERYQHPETGEVLECLGDLVLGGRWESGTRSHWPVAIVKRPSPSVDEEKVMWHCPECGWYLDEFLGVAPDGAVELDEDNNAT